MALRRINPRKKPLLPVPRPFSSSSSSNPPFPPPPPPPNASSHAPSSPAPNHGEAPNPQPVSSFFQDLRARLKSSPGPMPPRPFVFDTIRESTRKIEPLEKKQRPPYSPLPFLPPSPHTIFEKELGEKRATQAEGVEKENDTGVELLKEYSYQELGKRLAELRPAAAAGKDGKELFWAFWLEELRGRIANLAELEKKKQDPRFGGNYCVLWKTIADLKAIDEKAKAKIIMRKMSEYMLQRLPPQLLLKMDVTRREDEIGAPESEGRVQDV